MASKRISRTEQVFANLLTCSICFEDLNNPKQLPCIHEFCLTCLAGWLETHTDTYHIQCPTCRQYFLVPSGGLHGLPSNFKTKQLLELMTEKRAEKEEEEVDVKDDVARGNRQAEGEAEQSTAEDDIEDVMLESITLIVSKLEQMDGEEERDQELINECVHEQEDIETKIEERALELIDGINKNKQAMLELVREKYEEKLSELQYRTSYREKYREILLEKLQVVGSFQGSTEEDFYRFMYEQGIVELIEEICMKTTNETILIIKYKPTQDSIPLKTLYGEIECHYDATNNGTSTEHNSTGNMVATTTGTTASRNQQAQPTSTPQSTTENIATRTGNQNLFPMSTPQTTTGNTISASRNQISHSKPLITQAAPSRLRLEIMAEEIQAVSSSLSVVSPPTNTSSASNLTAGIIGTTSQGAQTNDNEIVYSGCLKPSTMNLRGGRRPPPPPRGSRQTNVTSNSEQGSSSQPGHDRENIATTSTNRSVRDMVSAWNRA